MLITDFRLLLAPISENPQRILDIGTGTGRDCVDLFDAHDTDDFQEYGLCKLVSHRSWDGSDKKLILVADRYPSAEVIGTGKFPSLTK
jgi:hypothetical protein